MTRSEACRAARLPRTRVVGITKTRGGHAPNGQYQPASAKVPSPAAALSAQIAGVKTVVIITNPIESPTNAQGTSHRKTLWLMSIHEKIPNCVGSSSLLLK